MNVELFEPSSPLLKKYIEFFYVLTRSPEDVRETYLTFPNIYTMVSVNQNAALALESNRIAVTTDKHTRIAASIAANYTKPLLIEYAGEANEITTGFSPLGLNAFTVRPVSTFLTRAPITIHFCPFSDFENSMVDIFCAGDSISRVSAMEFYWLSKLKGFEHRFLYEAVEDLSGIGGASVSIAALASKYGITQKTLIEHFTRYTGKTPSDFRKIVRFRKALDEQIVMETPHKLTEVTYLAQYFDQSHMIKDFKSLTGYTPGSFFKSLSAGHKGKISWIYLR